MDKLSNLIKGRLDKHNLSTSANAAEILNKANILIADQFGDLKSGIKAYRFSNGVVFIAVENSVLGQEVWGGQIAILNKLKKQFGKGKIKKIQIKSLTIN